MVRHLQVSGKGSQGARIASSRSAAGKHSIRLIDGGHVYSTSK